MACSVATCTCWTSVTSSLKILMLSKAVRSLSVSGVRMVAATFQPSFAKWTAVNLPRPLLVPVMNIVLVMSYPFYRRDFRDCGLNSPYLDEWTRGRARLSAGFSERAAQCPAMLLRSLRHGRKPSARAGSIIGTGLRCGDQDRPRNRPLPDPCE